jgi:hypothetical protein
MMIERAVQFGSGARLAGVLTEPSAGRARAGAPPVILINSGILHKVGSCRLYVKLARALAEEGFATLRFDLSGLGDSDVRRDAMSFEESSVAETRDAMDYLQRARGASEFILGGLCSGADVSHMTAVDDTRVVGVASIDARTHVTPGYWWHRYAPKVLSLNTWRKWFGRVVLGNRRSESGGLEVHPDEQAFELPTYVRVIPPREKLADELRTIVGRKSMLLYLFTDGLESYNHEGQHRRAFRDVRFGTLMTERHLRGSDHIITDLDLQRRAVDMHVAWAIDVANAASRRRASLPQPGASLVG